MATSRLSFPTFPAAVSRRRVLQVAGASVAGAAFAGVDAGFAARLATARQSAGKHAVINFGAPPYTLWTGVRFWTNSGVPSRMMFEPLLDIDENLMPAPGLAETWEIVSPTVSRYHLRGDAVWSDGEPITADDVVFSMNMTFHPDVANLMASEIASIKDGPEYTGGTAESVTGVRAVDERTVEIETAEPDTSIVRTLALRWWAPIPQHVYGEIAPADFVASPELAQPPVVSGPFRIDRIEPDKWFEMSANTDYWRGAPKLDSLTYVIGNIGDIVALADQGEFDYYVARTPDLAAALAANPNYDVTTVEYIQPYRIQLNCTLPEFQDARVRKAFAYALDRETLASQIFRGSAMPQYTDFLGDLLSPDAEVYSYDPDRARQLLAEAGWDPTTTVYFEQPALAAGQTPDPVAEAMNVAYQTWLGEVGITVEMRQHPDSATYADFTLPPSGEPRFGMYQNPHRRYDMYGPLEMKVYLLSPRNYAFWTNEQVDELVRQALAATDEATYVDVAQQLSVLVADECPYIPTMSVDWAVVAHNRFTGYTPIGEAYFAFMHPYDWDIVE